MGLKERAVFSLLAGLFFLQFFYTTKANFYTQTLDTAFMAEMIDTTLQFGFPRTRLTNSTIVAIKTFPMPAEKVCALPLGREPREYMNEFEKHSFLVFYLTAPFRLLFRSQTIVVFLHTFAFVGFLAIAYAILRERGVPIPASLAMVFLVSAFPAWSLSAMGQLNLDKWFLPFCLLYMFLLYERVTDGKLRSAALLIAGLLACTITERCSFMIGMATFAVLALYRGWRGWRRSDLLPLAIGAVAILYAVLYMKLSFRSDYGEYQVYMFNFLLSLRYDAPFVKHLWKYLLISIGMFGFISLFEWRLALIAFGAMLPNILGTIGGAEKTGWSTHYHAIYFPFLAAAVLIAFTNLYKRATSKPARWGLLAAALAMGAMLLLVDPHEGLLRFGFSNLPEYALRRTFDVLARNPAGRSLLDTSTFNREVAASVPTGAEVTTFEAMVPALYGDRWIHYYPIGLEASEYAVLRYDQSPDGRLRFGGAVSYLGPAEETKVNDCLSDRVRGAGYAVAKLYPYGGSGSTGIAVLKREK